MRGVSVAPQWNTGCKSGLVTAIVLLALSACTPAPTPSHIENHEHFSGLVNGRHDGARIRTACGGPVVAGRTGHPLAGQTLSVTQDPNGHGDTGGDSRAVYAQTAGSAEILQFVVYDVAQEIPTDIEVPCEGTGTVMFLQCFGIIACRDGAADAVKVIYENIAL